MQEIESPIAPPARRPAALPRAYHLGPEAFDYLRQLIHETSGIHLKDAKRQMVQSRLTKRLRCLDLDGFEAYIAYLRAHPEERSDMINRITTNKTHFFREPRHFRFLSDALLPELAARAPAGHAREVRGWCAASSTGEEPYTIAMILARFLETHRGWAARLLASDLDTAVLARARRGVYPADVLDGIPASLRPYTVSAPDGEAGTFGFSAAVTRLVQFRQINLMGPRYPIRSALDFIFCRNVFIYFTREGRDGVVRRFLDLLKPGGYLFVGHSEVLDEDDFGGRLRFAGNTTYQKVGP